MKIAVIGSGISGLSASYYLSTKHHVDLFEKDDHFGGHAHTIKIPIEDQKEVSVDIGFMVFNKVTYPSLINFFKENEIEIEKSDMSFSVNVKNTNIEYCGKGLNGIFSNRSNLLNYKFVKKKIKEEIDKVKSGEYDKVDNPIKNSPHTHVELIANKWEHKYEREEAAYPSEFLKTAKYWPPVGRVDNVYGDKNLFCTCPSMDEYEDTAA